MKEEVFYRVVAGLAADAVGLLRVIRDNTEKIMATQEEEANILGQIKTEFGQVLDEINAKISGLETALAQAGNTSPAVDSATADLKTAVEAALEQFKPTPPPA